MPLPSPDNPNGQSSIRNFFRPKPPAYVAPPSSASPKRDKQHQQQPSSPQSVPPPPPPPTLPGAAAAVMTTTTTTTTTTTSPRPLPNLHPQASISRIKPEHITALRRITALLLPVNYPDSFYERLSDPHSSGAFSRVILWRDGKKDKDKDKEKEKVVGGLVCRPELSPFHGGSGSEAAATATSQPPNALYIQSLVLLSPYRGLGLAAALLDEVVADAACSGFACETVWAHVWTRNDDGLRWYVARGFARVDEVRKYYHKLRPDSAWIVRRDIGGPGALLGLDGSRDATSGEVRRAGGPGGSVTAAVANLAPDVAAGASASSTSPGDDDDDDAAAAFSPPSNPAATATAAPHPSRPPLNPLSGGGAGRPAAPGQSFQNTRPETEWNDLPPDMQQQPGKAAGGGSSLSVPGTGSGASSRSSSSGRKKRDRAYPAAAFGN
ncbi:putative gcn5-related n acetyltransferase protein [Rosellinia necatrix]|uniref:Putative gcn5-related n acetyltransferase protein n=1 Tax=Rosellinia necatrix TaxID=77044 RepID=A0A1W2TVA9_ROSNE|nr:putative gcn5-related n acetyltransferase protein [Rosellinia necatrix]